MNNIRTVPRFHYAFPVKDLKETENFFVNNFGCEIGRQTDEWIDFNFFGHQISAHLKPEELKAANTNSVDGKDVPVRHFGVILDWNEWHTLSAKLKKSGIKFIIEPYIRFKGKTGEQATMFFLDPSGNAIEIKSFKDESCLFEAY